MRSSYSLDASLDSLSVFRRTGWNSCKEGAEATFSEHRVTETGSAGTGGQADVGVNMGPDGNYSIAVGRLSESPSGVRRTTGSLSYGPACGYQAPTSTHQKANSYAPSVRSPDVEGKVDPDSDKIFGTKIEVEKQEPGIVITRTCIWIPHR